MCLADDGKPPDAVERASVECIGFKRFPMSTTRADRTAIAAMIPRPVAGQNRKRRRQRTKARAASNVRSGRRTDRTMSPPDATCARR